ncbi:sensor histidine kinase [Sphingomonas nostoxanthinifaciens]|uniref:sensor histidine kinase n=1 Tax=Sphingomonas nostoxanthinifaciens TaxID=2872652 RepID=UPI001CC1D8BE|nr:HAMP domain-containing sensor histidine kinase [Sphingomonas nostoxanthinifaciens]UAK23205.1 HAMP domain-containing histidine kinase [Sphingomonas nostoxanthinifaciens]
MRLTWRIFRGPARLDRLAIQLGLAFAIAMVTVGMVGFSLADNWVSSRIDTSLRYHTAKYLSEAGHGPGEDARLQAKILEWQHRKVLSERTYVLFDRTSKRIAGRLDITPPPPGFSDLRFTGGGHNYQIGRGLATRLPSGSLFVVVQHSEAAMSLHALLPIVVLIISLAALILGLSATLLFAHLTAKRLSETQNTAAAIAAGDLSRRIPTDRLDGMFAVQAESLNRMLDHMEELVRAQQLFSSNLAHDLRTPLTRLRSLLEKASREGQSTFPSLMERADRECASIISIFDALLRLAEIETGRHPTAMSAVSLRPLIEDIADTMEPVISDHGGTLRVRRLDDVSITGDPDLINQLLINLLENVATHTPPGTSATLSLEHDGGSAVIVVRDDGPGLAVGDFARVTQPFERGSAVSSGGGSGLGLAIANAIARFHRGSLDLTDATPGLVVQVRIPANDSAHHSDAAEQSAL